MDPWQEHERCAVVCGHSPELLFKKTYPSVSLFFFFTTGVLTFFECSRVFSERCTNNSPPVLENETRIAKLYLKYEATFPSTPLRLVKLKHRPLTLPLYLSPFCQLCTLRRLPKETQAYVNFQIRGCYFNLT